MKKHSEIGGGKTTKNGNKFEDSASIRKTFEENGYIVSEDDILYDSQNNQIGRFYKKTKLMNLVKKYGINIRQVWSKTLEPDDALFLQDRKEIYIFEMKYQEGEGSVDEKLQTVDFKKWKYKRLFDLMGIKFHFCYILCSKFQDESYKDVIEYYKEFNHDYFFNHIDLDYFKLQPIKNKVQWTPSVLF